MIIYIAKIKGKIINLCKGIIEKEEEPWFPILFAIVDEVISQLQISARAQLYQWVNGSH